MPEADGDLPDLLDFAVDLVHAAGAVTLKHFNKRLHIEHKSDGSPVTVADRETEMFLRKALQIQFPEDGVLGEEDGEIAGSSGRRWIIDPIDGTFAFIHGVPFYGVMLGLEINGVPSLGVVNMPALNEIVYAARGEGCYWNGERARVSAVDTMDNALVLTTEFALCEQSGFGPAIEPLKRTNARWRTWGDCYGHLLVATGRAEIMLDPIMKIWDCAALQPILEEAGGTFTDWKGTPSISGGNAVSTNGNLFIDVFEAIRGA